LGAIRRGLDPKVQPPMKRELALLSLLPGRLYIDKPTLYRSCCLCCVFVMDSLRKAAHRKLVGGVSGGGSVGGGVVRGSCAVEPEGQRVIVSISSRTKVSDQLPPPPSFDRSIGVSADSRPARAESETSTRSSTPATDASNYYTPSTSSLATSAPLDGECGFPPDDEVESCGSKWNQWDEEYV